MKPNILIVNDDGIQSPGIQALANAMENIGSITIVAPDQEQSAKSHSITLNDPIRLKLVTLKRGLKGWSVKGTPVDCAKIALKSLFKKKKPDLLISGINLGSNLGKNLIYSGTISAAYEGTILGIPSAAISLDSFQAKDFTAAKHVSISIATYLLKNNLPRGTMLNVNIPYLQKNKIKGFRVTKQGKSGFIDTFEKRVDPRGESYFWIKGEIGKPDSSIEFDGEAISNGYVSITPIEFDLTNKRFINKLKKDLKYD
mgnify:FL=1